MSIKHLAAEKAINVLAVLRAKFIVVMEDGTRYEAGDLVLAPVRAASMRKALTHKKGFITDIFRARVDAMAVGDVVLIDCHGAITADRMRAAMGSYAGSKWGAGAWTSCSDMVARTAELMRLA